MMWQESSQEQSSLSDLQLNSQDPLLSSQDSQLISQGPWLSWQQSLIFTHFSLHLPQNYSLDKEDHPSDLCQDQSQIKRKPTFIEEKQKTRVAQSSQQSIQSQTKIKKAKCEDCKKQERNFSGYFMDLIKEAIINIKQKLQVQLTKNQSSDEQFLKFLRQMEGQFNEKSLKNQYGTIQMLKRYTDTQAGVMDNNWKLKNELINLKESILESSRKKKTNPAFQSYVKEYMDKRKREDKLKQKRTVNKKCIH